MENVIASFFEYPPDFLRIVTEVKEMNRDNHLESDFKYPDTIAELIEMLKKFRIIRCKGKHHNFLHGYQNCKVASSNLVC